jgi:hypothetical protein
MKAYRGSGGITPLVTLALDGGEWSTHAPVALSLAGCLAAHCIYGWVGPKASLHTLDGISISCTYRESNHDSSGSPASSIVTVLTELFCPVVCNAKHFFSMRRNVYAWRYIPFSITGRGVVEAFALLRCYIAYVGSSLPTNFLLEGGSDTSVTNYWSTLRNIPEEWTSQVVGYHEYWRNCFSYETRWRGHAPRKLLEDEALKPSAVVTVCCTKHGPYRNITVSVLMWRGGAYFVVSHFVPSIARIT